MDRAIIPFIPCLFFFVLMMWSFVSHHYTLVYISLALLLLCAAFVLKECLVYE